MEAISADQFTWAELTDLYNETRSDYIVPMPMSEKRLKAYAESYDVDLSASVVVRDEKQLLGLGMLGVRPKRSWITRLGVVPDGRRRGVGQMLMDGMSQSTAKLGLTTMWLEVIKNNDNAHRMFRRYGFVETRELLVIRRPPNLQLSEHRNESINQIVPLEAEETLHLLRHRRRRPNWLNQTESLENVPNLKGLLIETKNGECGWVAFDLGRFQLTHVYVEVTYGDPSYVAAVILQALHNQHPLKDTVIENVPTHDPMWPGFQRLGYFDAFRRIEMVKQMEWEKGIAGWLNHTKK
ncbi:MAG TPA: GNAT family N-acetyltransferase [Anaerolineae bacterium]|nr:GNAT family N-acetyltransferase [Anaerolineae bacterium]